METKNISYGFYSKVLNKPFDTLDELVKAEELHNKAEAEKLEKANTKKAEAKKVELAISDRLRAETEASNAKHKAYTEYLKACDLADKKVADMKKAEQKSLKEFCEKYGAFHSTITLDDVTYDIHYDEEEKINSFEKLLRWWI